MRRASQVHQPGHKHNHEHRHNSQREDESKLLANHGENEVGVRFRKKVNLLPSLPQSGAIDAAHGESGERLIKLVSATALVAFYVQEGGESAKAIRVMDDHDGETAR